MFFGDFYQVNGQIVEKYQWLNLTTLLAIYDANDNVVQRFEYSGGRTPTRMTQDGQRYYIISDYQGSPKLVTDRNGNMVKAIGYDSFGNVIEDSNPGFRLPFGYAGGLYDPETGFVRFGYRDYDPDAGRWTAKDPIRFGGGQANLYSYVLNNPISFVDPVGLWSLSIDIYAGVGISGSVGVNPDGSWFLTGKAGVGLGGGISLDPNGQAPGYDSCDANVSFTSSGTEFGVGAGFGPFSAGYSSSSGTRVNEWGREADYSNSGFGYNLDLDGKWEFRLGGSYAYQKTTSHAEHMIVAGQ